MVHNPAEKPLVQKAIAAYAVLGEPGGISEIGWWKLLDPNERSPERGQRPPLQYGLAPCEPAPYTFPVHEVLLVRVADGAGAFGNRELSRTL